MLVKGLRVMADDKGEGDVDDEDEDADEDADADGEVEYDGPRGDDLWL